MFQEMSFMTERPVWLALIFVFLIWTVIPGPQTHAAAEPTPKPAGQTSANPFDKFQSFTAILNGGIGDDHDRKVYRSGNLMRSDFEDSYRISDLNTRTSWTVHPNRCAEFPVPDAATYPFSAYHDFKIARSMTDENAIVDGHACKIENVTFTRKDGGSVIKMKLWEANDLSGFPIKIEIEANGRPTRPVRYSDVSLNPPDPKLFVHPAKCTPGAAAGQKGTVGVSPAAPK